MSSPLRSASRDASARATSVPATTSWLQALVSAPAPTGPIRVMVVPRTSSTGRTRSKTSSSPPHMIDKVPSSAFATPPDRQASTTSTLPASRSASSRTATGDTVLITTSVDAPPASTSSSIGSR